jgi:hypothetical protein
MTTIGRNITRRKKIITPHKALYQIVLVDPEVSLVGNETVDLAPLGIRALFPRPFVLVGHRFASSFQQRGW